MKITKYQFNKILKEAKKIYRRNNDPFHSFEHAWLVSKTAVIIAKKEKADVEVCKVAGLLHDIAPKKRGLPHGKKSAAKTLKILNHLKIKRAFLDQVIEAIKYHDTSKSRLIGTREGKIIFDADKLQCFGAIGIFREFGDLLIKGWEGRKAIQETLRYIIEYNPRLFTKSGRKIKKQLRRLNLNFYQSYYRQIKI